MKLHIFISCLCITSAYCAPTVPEVKEVPSEPVVAVPVQQPQQQFEQDATSASIQIPVDNAKKLLYDLDATVNQLFGTGTPVKEEKIEVDAIEAKEEKSDDVPSGSGSSGTVAAVVDDAQVYSAANRELDFYPRQSQAAQGQTLVNQLENVEKRLLQTITEQQKNNRPTLTLNLLRQMYNSVHRIRVNINRVQTQFSSPQTAAAAQPAPSRPAPSSGIMQNLQNRVSDIQKAVNDIISRVSGTFTAGGSQSGQNKPPGHTVQA